MIVFLREGVGPEQFEAAVGTDDAAWRAELELHRDHLHRLAHRMPAALVAIRERYAAQVADA